MVDTMAKMRHGYGSIKNYEVFFLLARLEVVRADAFDFACVCVCAAEG